MSDEIIMLSIEYIQINKYTVLDVAANFLAITIYLRGKGIIYILLESICLPPFHIRRKRDEKYWFLRMEQFCVKKK